MADQTDPIDHGRETLLGALRDGDVRFVVIGGAALQSHGERYETEDIDIGRGTRAPVAIDAPGLGGRQIVGM